MTSPGGGAGGRGSRWPASRAGRAARSRWRPTWTPASSPGPELDGCRGCGARRGCRRGAGPWRCRSWPGSRCCGGRAAAPAASPRPRRSTAPRRWRGTCAGWRRCSTAAGAACCGACSSSAGPRPRCCSAGDTAAGETCPQTSSSHYGRSHWSPDLTGSCHGTVTSHTEDSHLSHVTLVPALGNHCSDYCATVPLVRLLPHCQHCKHGRVTAGTGPHPGWRARLLSLGAGGGAGTDTTQVT